MSDAVIAAGYPAYTAFVVSSFSQGTGQQFSILGQPFLTDSSLVISPGIPGNTATSVNLSIGTAMQKAAAIKAMLLSNPAFEGLITVDITDASPDALIAVTFIESGAIPSSTTDFAALSAPYPVLLALPGANPNVRPCYSIWWQVYERTEFDGDVPVSEVEVSTPPTGATGFPTAFCIDIASKVQALLHTEFPLSPSVWSTIQYDQAAMRKVFFIKYGVATCPDGCGKVLEAEMEGPEIRVLNAALQQGDTAGLCGVTGMFLSERTTAQVCQTDADWLWLVVEAPAATGIFIGTEYQIAGDQTWYASGLPSVTTGIDGGGVLRIPSGPANYYAPGAIPANAVRYRITARSNAINGPVLAQKEYCILPAYTCACGDNSILFYFLNKYGGYDVLHFCNITDQTVIGDLTMVCHRVGCLPALSEANYGNEPANRPITVSRLARGDSRVVKSGITRRFTAEVEQIGDKEETRALFTSFLRSPLKYAIVKVDGVQYQREVYVSISERSLLAAPFKIEFYYAGTDSVKVQI